MTTSTINRIHAAAAEARSQGVAAATDRPSQRRSAETPGAMRGAACVRAPRMTLRAAGDDGGRLHFGGFASVYEAPYEMWDAYGPYVEQVMPGAGAVSLARPDLDVPLVLDHESIRRIARTTNDTLTLSEATETIDDVELSGLLVDAPSLDPEDADVAYIAPKLRAGLIDEMSFRFRIVRGSWSPDWMEYHIVEYDLHRGDVAIVGYGANPYTAGAGLRSGGQLPALDRLSDAQLLDIEHRLHAERRRRGAPAEPAMTLSEVIAASNRTALTTP